MVEVLRVLRHQNANLHSRPKNVVLRVTSTLYERAIEISHFQAKKSVDLRYHYGLQLDSTQSFGMTFRHPDG